MRCGQFKCSNTPEKRKCQLLSCVRLCNPMAYNPPGFSVHGILQARVLEWVGFHSPGNLSNPGMEPGSPVLQVDMYPNYILSLLLNNAKCLEIRQKFTLKQCKVLEISQKFTYNFTVSFLHPWLNLPQTRYYCNIYH